MSGGVVHPSEAHGESMQRSIRIDGEELYGSDPRRSRPLPQERDELPQRWFIALRERLDRSIRRVPHPAHKTKFLGRMYHGVPIADTLDTTGNRHGDRLLICHLPHRYTSERASARSDLLGATCS